MCIDWYHCHELSICPPSFWSLVALLFSTAMAWAFAVSYLTISDRLGANYIASSPGGGVILFGSNSPIGLRLLLRASYSYSDEMIFIPAFSSNYFEI